MWNTITITGDEVQRGDVVSGRVVVKVKRARRQGPVTLTHKDGYTEITRTGAIQVERLVEDDDGYTDGGRHRREKVANGMAEQRSARIRPRAEHRTRREISERANRGSGNKGNRSI